MGYKKNLNLAIPFHLTHAFLIRKETYFQYAPNRAMPHTGFFCHGIHMIGNRANQVESLQSLEEIAYLNASPPIHTLENVRMTMRLG